MCFQSGGGGGFIKGDGGSAYDPTDVISSDCSKDYCPHNGPGKGKS